MAQREAGDIGELVEDVAGACWYEGLGEFLKGNEDEKNEGRCCDRAGEIDMPGFVSVRDAVNEGLPTRSPTAILDDEQPKGEGG